MRRMVRTTSPNTRAGAVDLAILALEKRDLLAVFADAREIEAEVRLDRLLAEVKPRQAAADELGDACREASVKDRDPEQKARDSHAEDRRVEGVGNPPQDDRERDQIGRGGDRLDGVIVDADVAGIDAGPGAVDEAADILRNALIGVVGRDVLIWEFFRRLLGLFGRTVASRAPACNASSGCSQREVNEAVIQRRHCSTKFEATKNSTMPETMAIVASGTKTTMS